MNQFDEDFSLFGAFADFDDVEDMRLDENEPIEAPFIPLRDLVLFPHMVTPLFVGRLRSLEAIEAAQQGNRVLICATQKDPDAENPGPDDIYRVGVEVVLGRALRMPDGTTSALVQGRRRVVVTGLDTSGPYLRATAQPIPERTEHSTEIKARMRTVLTLFEKCVQLNRSLPEDAYMFALNIEDPSWLADLVATTLDLSTEQRQHLLEISDPGERLMEVITLLGKELEVLEIEDHIHMRVQEEVDKTQREMFLREQMRVIQSELGESDLFQQEIGELHDRLQEVALPDHVREKAEREISRLAAMPPMAPEVGIIRTYLEWLLELPWTNASEDNLDVKHVARVLDEEHYGLEKAKERILEYIAVRRLAPDKMKQPILCFVGPPGTGKTSLGRSIAKALGREFVRVSLGGVHDEAEIRGHRRTYIGAMPGRIIQTMRRAGTVNPLFMLDEIDKLGMDFRGDPSAALLEVLDPEQNYAFSDHYLEVDYDLSRVMFVTTANYIDPIPPALKDRLEIIEFPGYIEEEKLAIARHFLVPRQLEAHGIADRGVTFEQAALTRIIREYTYEAGVRNLEREIANVCRKIARRVAEERPYPKRITAASLQKYLGPPRIPGPLITDKDEVGLALGIAWTEVGGDVLPVEVTLMPGKGTLTLTGQLGDIMQESAQAALSYTRSRADDFGIDPDVFENTDVHIHLPEGAVPKDGPSAGVTLATALISAFTQRPVRHDLVMTGEITLRGRVLSVGGIKEKVLAAHRCNIKDVIIPAENENDLEEIPRRARRALNFIKVRRMDEVLDAALLEPIGNGYQPHRGERNDGDGEDDD
ncbi:MAG TPA: endopeptidase La [Aggregatilineales bacterium]|nr:endopeptidase La [Aggregatilineales bacterium]HQE18472.1 endopeptidase La [Aggregatilineales bacterium]